MRLAYRLALCALVLTSSALTTRVALAEDEGAPDKETECLAKGIYFEARGEPLDGQLAVGRVILNRKESERYPDTICGVVYQNAERKNRCQFSFACDGRPDLIAERKLWKSILAEAAALLDCEETCEESEDWPDGVGASTHYHTTAVNPSWSRKLRMTGRIGRHLFYASAS
ncbi:cell wall hydrolase [Propylenella binzhouense]|uniref:Cell wall hydrolase n=1 Tax=Propylenella binzhouense TaxID=2555902 RepID=A0A964T9U4_9HYPH|nr:cell wall hydrolase [Propylenella binzhouense]MYZ49977.1 cell wall hydrolase [Propylenella binzhouense]